MYFGAMLHTGCYFDHILQPLQGQNAAFVHVDPTLLLRTFKDVPILSFIASSVSIRNQLHKFPLQNLVKIPHATIKCLIVLVSHLGCTFHEEMDGSTPMISH